MLVHGDRPEVVRGTATAVNPLDHRRTIGRARTLRLVTNAKMPRLQMTWVIPAAGIGADEDSSAVDP